MVERDLAAALKNRTIAGAALDVRATEPPQPGDLEQIPNLILLPHIAALTHEAQRRVTRAICEDVARVRRSDPAERGESNRSGLVAGVVTRSSRRSEPYP